MRATANLRWPRHRNETGRRTSDKLTRFLFPILTIASVLIGTPALWAQGASNRIPARAQFGDSPADKLRSDGIEAYINGSDCVISWVDSKSGFYFLRTVKYGCTTTAPRAIVLDFSDAISRTCSCPCSVPDPNDNSGATLDLCGQNSLPDVRVIADTLFRNNALSLGTTVTLPFSLQPDFRGTDFGLDFEQAVPVTGGSTERVLQAGPDAIAELYQTTKTGQKISLGRFRMPFTLTVSKLQ